MKAAILGTGLQLPQKKLTNKDLEGMVNTSDEWITTRSGIKERYIVSGKETLSSLSTEASKKALEMAKIDASELDLIIVATFTADFRLPSAATLVQNNLKAYNAVAFDIAAACTGFIYGLVIAEKFIKDNPKIKALVIGAEVLSSVTNWEDRTTCVLFGDGAGAALVSGAENRGILATYIKSDPRVWDLLCVLGGGSLYPPFQNGVPKEEYYVRMKGNEVFKYSVRYMEEAARIVLDKAGMSPADIDWLIPHQANIRIMKMIAKKLGIPEEKVFINIDKYGNTSAATIPIALDEAVRQGAIKPGDLVLLDAFGGGFTYGAVLLRW
ncbi:3-oxoacyl-[acyl-carrier-protein] synthase 3 [Candidatus Methanoperedenaceae archaeon GB50]|nr:3-oxoacyl-[acyl-carrier-protein] synthase 3 [Candidatus Methanoperedenaceae archaeon GB50]